MSGPLPNWLQRWLGVDAPGRGEGTVWTLEHHWGWAPWLSVLFVLFAVGWVAYFYWREGPAARRGYKALLTGLRLAAIALVCLMLAELMLSLHRTGLPHVVVIVDDSASMGIADRLDDARLASLVQQALAAGGRREATRLNLAKSLLLDKEPGLLAAIDRRYKLKVYFAAASARAQSDSLDELRKAIGDLSPTGEASRLGEAVRGVLAALRGAPPAAIVILSDGITTDGPPLSDAARLAHRKGVPLFTIGLGTDKPVRDLELADLLVDEVVFVDDVVNFEFKLTGSGFAGKSVEVTLKEKGNPEVLARTKATVGPDGVPQRVALPYRPTKVGQFEYVVEVEHLKDETQAANNHQQRMVSVRKEHVRVLLVQGYPSYEFRYLKQMLRRDSTIELKTVQQDADPDFVPAEPTALPVFPLRREELFEYDVLVLGDVDPALLNSTSLAHVAAFVEEKGGGLALVAGPQFMPLAFRNTPLAPLVPIDLSTASAPETGRAITAGFVPAPTDLGLASPHMLLGDAAADTARIWKDLPPLYWLLSAPTLKPGARVLAEHPSELTGEGRKLPVIVMQYFGKGKVLFHATDETWRWRWRVGDVFFARYWVQSIRYLSRAKLLGKDRAAELAADKREYRRGEGVRLRARFVDERQAPADDDGVTVVLERPGSTHQQVRLRRNATNRGVFEGLVTGLGDGGYHARMATPTLPGQAPAADFLVLAPPGEFERLEMDTAELNRAAEETRGRSYRFETAGKLLAQLPPGRQVPIESLAPLKLWNQPPVLVALLAVLVTEWLLRKRKGML